MKNKFVAFDKILSKELNHPDFKILFHQRRFYLQIAHLISELRTKQGLTQKDLAIKSGLSQPMIARLEKGDSRRTPTFETIYKLLSSLGYNLSIHIQKERRSRAA